MVIIGDDNDKLILKKLASAKGYQEEDVPISASNSMPLPSQLDLQRAKTEEKTRRYGLVITITCVIIILFVYIMESYLKSKGLETPEGLSANIIDIMKTIILVALGHLFSKVIKD